MLQCVAAAASDRTVVIPVEFDNMKLRCSAEQIREMVDSAAAFMGRQLHGRKELCFDLTETVCLARPYEYYGSNSPDRKDFRIPDALIEVCRKIDAGYDFSSAENVVLITAGYNESYGGDESFFWPLQSKLSDFNLSLTLDGRKIDSFGICPELGPDNSICGIGDFCHEYGHFLGLVDLYDTDGSGSGGISRVGLDTLSLMATGNRNGNGHRPAPLCAADYFQLRDFPGIPLEKGEFTLEPVGSCGSFAIMDCATPGEFLLLENRNGAVHITRIDRTRLFSGFSDRLKRNLTAEERWQFNEVNCNPEYQCADLVWQGSDGVFSIDSLAISNIRKTGEAFVFDVFEPVVITCVSAYQDCISISWISEMTPASIVNSGIGWWAEETELNDRDAVRLDDGSFHFTIEDLSPGTDYNLSIHISTVDGQSFSRTIAVRTQPRRDDARPFIMLDGADRNEDGTFRPGSRLPLRLRNGAQAVGIEWTFNGKSIRTDADGLWTIPSSGKLRARITLIDGSEEVIDKQINVR